MDEEFFIEESNPKKVLKVLFLILFITGIFAGLYYFYFYHEDIKLKNITVELGEKLPTDVNDYIKGDKLYDFKIDLSKVSVDENGITDSVGEYSYKIYANNDELKGKIYVKDTTPPIVELRELEVGLNEEFDPHDFIVSCSDLSLICDTYYHKKSDEKLNGKEGEYTLTLEIKDKYGNTTLKETKLKVSKDYSLGDKKSGDKEVFKVYPIDENWNNTYTVKFEKGILEEDDNFESEILALTNFDFSTLFEETIVNQTLLTIYNKYDYVIGFSMKVELDNGKIVYVLEKDLKTSTED